MATKPTDTAPWATDETNNVNPSSGQKASGWTPGQVAISSYFNDWQLKVHRWLEWLDDSVVDFGDATQVSAGALAADTLQPLTAPYVDVLGDMTVQGDLSVVGDVKVAGALGIPAQEFQLEAGGTASLGDGQWTFGAVSVIAAPIKLPVGARLTSPVLHYNRGGAGTITWTICKRSSGGGKTVLHTETVNTGTGLTTRTATGVNYTVEAGVQLYTRIAIDNAAHVIQHIDAPWDWL